MLVAPGPIEVVQAMKRRRKLALAKAIAACAMRLLVVGAIGRQLVAHLIERLADAGDIAMAEDRQDAAEDRHVLAVDLGHLRASGSAPGPAPWSGGLSCSSLCPPRS